MPNLFRVSEMSALGLHAMALLAGTPGRLVQTREIARRLQASEATLTKVLIALRRARLIKTMRGPKGGSALGRSPERISLKQIYEAVEGKLKVGKCMFNHPVCGRRRCALGGFLEDINRQVADKLKETKLSDFTLAMGGKRGQ